MSSCLPAMALPKEVTFVTFDVYGTLIDWETGVYNAFAKEAEKDGYTLSKEELVPLFLEIQQEIKAGSYELYAEVLRRTAVQISRQLGWPLEPSRSGFLPDSVKRWPPFKETNTQLERMRKKFELGLISNIDDKLLGETRRWFKTDFDLVVTAQQVRSYKPDPAHFKEAERRIGTKKGWVHVASSYYYDVEPCLKAKVPVIWVNRHKEALDASQKKPTAEVRTLLEAAKLLGAALEPSGCTPTSSSPPPAPTRPRALWCAAAARRSASTRRCSPTSSRSCRRWRARPASTWSGCWPRTPTGTTCSGGMRFPRRRWAARRRPRRGWSTSRGSPSASCASSTTSCIWNARARCLCRARSGCRGRATWRSATEAWSCIPRTATPPTGWRSGSRSPACSCAATTCRR